MSVGSGGMCIWSLLLGGRGRWISEIKVSLGYSEFHDSQGYTEKPCLKYRKMSLDGLKD